MGYLLFGEVGTAVCSSRVAHSVAGLLDTKAVLTDASSICSAPLLPLFILHIIGVWG